MSRNRGMHVAIVGAGLMGRWHADAACRLGAEILAVVDTNTEAARQLARKSGSAVYCGTLRDVFERRTPIAVHVCTPLSTHATITREALRLGAHVVCEKPITGDARATEELLDSARSVGRYLLPVHQFTAQRGVRRVLGFLPELGDLSRLSFDFCSAGASSSVPGSRNEVVADILPHPLSILSTLLPHVGLRELVWNVSNPRDGEVSVQSVFEGIPIQITISMSARPTRCSMSIFGTRASAYADFFHGFAVKYPGKVSRRQKIFYPFTDSLQLAGAATLNLVGRSWRRELAYPGLRQLLSEFYAAIKERTPPPIGVDGILAVAVARDNIVGAMTSYEHRGQR